MMKRLRYLYALFICFFVLGVAIFVIAYVSGLQRHKNQDPFYSTYDEGVFGKIRFPLIKPYEVTKAIEEDGWVLELLLSPSDAGKSKNVHGYFQLWHMKLVAVEDGVIMAYSPDSNPNAVAMGHKAIQWFVIIPNKNTETGFETEADFLAYIDKFGIIDPHWIDTEAAFEQFHKTGCLDWIPDCSQP